MSNTRGSPEDRARRSAQARAAWQRGAYANISARLRAAWQRGAFANRTWEQTPEQLAGMRKASLASQTPSAIAKRRQALTGKPKSDAHRAAMSAAARRRVARPEDRRSLVDRGRKAAERNRGRRHTDARRARESAAQRQRFQDPTQRLLVTEHCLAIAGLAGSRKYEFLDRRGRLHLLRSRYEQRYAEMLDRAELNWWYERDRLLLSTGEVYVPDFYVEQWASYVEIKGARFSTEKTEQAIRDGHPVLFIHIKSKAMLNAALRFLEPQTAAR